MPIPAWREEPVGKGHARDRFDCGQAELNTFLARYARQAHQSGSSKTYCAIAHADEKSILGYYTISPAQIELSHVPQAARPSGGSHYALGGFRLGRLAVDRTYQGQGLGGQLLARAIGRCMRVSSEVGGTALLIDAKDEAAARWYRLYGAMPLIDRSDAALKSN